jgi:hypothetical protein
MAHDSASAHRVAFLINPKLGPIEILGALIPYGEMHICSCACARTRDERSLSAAPFKNHQICATICETGIGDLNALLQDKAERIVEMWK